MTILISQKMGGKVCLLGNLNPYDEIELLSGNELQEAIKKQLDAGRQYGKFMNCAGSPLTPNTSAQRIRQFVDFAHIL